MWVFEKCHDYEGFFQVVALHYLYKLMVQQNYPNLTLLAFMTFLTLKIMI